MNSTTSGAGAGGGQEDQEELCFEVIATVLEIFGRMDSLVGGVYFHFHSHCDTHRRTSALTNMDLAKRFCYHIPFRRINMETTSYVKFNVPPSLVIAWRLAQCPTHLLVFVVEQPTFAFDHIQTCCSQSWVLYVIHAYEIPTLTTGHPRSFV